MSWRDPNSRYYLSIPYATIEFVVVNDGAENVRHQINCALSFPVRDLKESYAEQFGIPAHRQKWFCQNRLLNDENNLLNSGIESQEVPEIVVRT